MATMKLSAAIREGAKLRPQCRGAYFDGTGSCAIGAAMEAGGYNVKKLPNGDFRDIKWLTENLEGFIENESEIMKRNDELGETRESIADWLEKQGF